MSKEEKLQLGSKLLSPEEIMALPREERIKYITQEMTNKEAGELRVYNMIKRLNSGENGDTL